MTVYGLNSGGDSIVDLNAFTSAFQPTFPILLDANSTYNQYRQTGATSPYPLDYIIDQQGNVAYSSTEYHPEEMIAIIDELLLHPSPVEDIPAPAPISLIAAPNPFNPRTNIQFTLNHAGPVSLNIHDSRGRLIRTLVQGQNMAAGSITLPWDGTNQGGNRVAAGAYLVRLVTAQGENTRKITLLK